MDGIQPEDYKAIALWAADCQAATLEHLKGLKSASKADIRRHTSICHYLLASLRAGALITNSRPSKEDWVLKRLEDALNGADALAHK